MVSIAVPVFNGARYLQACLNSILTQTWTDFEVVVSDDCSTDGSDSIISGFQDSRIVRLPRPEANLGLHSNWQRVLQSCRGEFVKLVCQDDLIHPECLSTQVENLLLDPDAGLASNRRVVIDDNGSPLIHARGIGSMSTVLPSPTAADVAFNCVRAGTNLLGEPASVLFRRVAMATPFVSDRWSYAVDLDMYMRCLARGWRAVVDERIVASFRVSPSQLSAVLARSQSREMRAYLWELAQTYRTWIGRDDLIIGMAKATLLAFARRHLYTALRIRQKFSSSLRPHYQARPANP